MNGIFDSTVLLMIKKFPEIILRALSNLGGWLTGLFRSIADLFSQIVGAIFEGREWTLGSGEIITAVVVILLVIGLLLLFILHEPRRRFFVALKRKPQNIPLVVLALAFVIYSFNLTHISNTTTLIQGPNMGLTAFVTMLGSTLMMVCCMNAFPYRKKVKIPMLILMFVMILIVLYCDTYYYTCISNALNRPTDAIVATETTNSFVLSAMNVVCTHYGILILGCLLAILLPAYTPLIRRIRTSIDVEGNEDMAAIDISGE